MNEKKIFSRNVLFWGEKNQRKIRNSTVLVAGIGGLGCFVAEILVRCGIGKLILLDNGIVDEPDLNRQILYNSKDLGKTKVTVAKTELQKIHGKTEIITLNCEIRENGNFMKKIAGHKINGIADCLDNFESRFVLEKFLGNRQFLVHGGVSRDFGQITTTIKNKTPLLKDIYANSEEFSGPVPISPPVVGAVGNVMVQEIINNLFGRPQLVNQLLVVEFSDFSFFKQKI